jgi:hypothetical protein
MFSTTIKRSVATLGVVAGLLAAAVPASAQIGPATMGNLHTEPGPRVASSEVFELNTFGGNDSLDARGTQVGSEGVKAPATLAGIQSEVEPVELKAGSSEVLYETVTVNQTDWEFLAEAEGTQVGSEGVKAPTQAEQSWVWHEAARNGVVTNNNDGGKESRTSARGPDEA